ncbi:MAG: IS701 family transposase [Candidatus Levyibacteriota bacterium]
MNKQLLDIYTDYLISSFSYTTVTGLSDALAGAISHDKITRFLSKEDYDSRQLWKLIKPTICKIETGDGVLIVDDTIEEKQYTDESELITWHFDHTFGRSVKGVNILSLLYHNQAVTIPVGFQPIQKTEKYTDKKTGKERRKSEKTKNEYFQEMAKVAIVANKIKCRWILADVWFSSNDNMEYIKFDLKKDFVMPIKTNRLVSRTKEEKRKGKFQQVETLNIAENTSEKIYIKELPFPVLLVKQVFKNENGSNGILYLICSDRTVEGKTIMDVYQKRWPIEEYHKSIKSNTGLAKSPTKTIRTQQNHFFASIYAYYKLEVLKIKTNLNHFAIKAKLYVQALRASMDQLEKLQLAS